MVTIVMISGMHRLRLGLHGYLIRLATLALAPYRQSYEAYCFRFESSVRMMDISPDGNVG